MSTDTDGVVRIQLKIGDDIVTATLNDTPPAREFAAMLPIDHQHARAVEPGEGG